MVLFVSVVCCLLFVGGVSCGVVGGGVVFDRERERVLDVLRMFRLDVLRMFRWKCVSYRPSHSASLDSLHFFFVVCSVHVVVTRVRLVNASYVCMYVCM